MFPFWKMSFIFTHHTQDTKDVLHCQLFRRTFLINVVCVTGEDSQTTPEAWLQYDMQDQSPCGERGACFVHHQGVQFLRRIVLAERVPRRERWKRQDGVVSHASHLRARATQAICEHEQETRLTDALTRGVFCTAESKLESIAFQKKKLESPIKKKKLESVRGVSSSGKDASDNVNSSVSVRTLLWWNTRPCCIDAYLSAVASCHYSYYLYETWWRNIQSRS